MKSVTGQISRSITDLEQVIQQNADAAREISETAEEVHGESARMRESISYFHLGNGSVAREQKRITA